MPDLVAIREGIADALNAIPELQASPYMLSNPTPPSAHVFPDEVDYDQTMGRGHDDWFMTVQAFVGMITDIGAQKRLDLMLNPAGAYSVKAAIEADSTLGGVVDDVQVQSCTGYRVYARSVTISGSGDPVLGAEWRVWILAAGD